MFKDDLLRMMRQYRIPATDLDKEVLVDEKIVEELTDYIKKGVTAPFAFPGFIFRYTKGEGYEKDERKRKAVSEEFGIKVHSWDPPEYDLIFDNVYVEPEVKYAKDVIDITLQNLPEISIFVTRESVLLHLIAEPGWKEYGPSSVVFNIFYDVADSFRLPNDSFFPVGKSSMGVVIGERISKYRYIEEFYNFLKQAFSEKRKKLRVGEKVYDKRPLEIEPEEFLSIFETTFR